DADYQTLKDDYTARTAAVLRAIEDDRAAFASARPRRRPLRLVVAGVVIAALALGAGLLVAQSSDDRNPGDVATGSDLDTPGERLAEAERLADKGQVLKALE